MSLSTLGFFNLAIEPAILSLIGHSFISAGLFFLVGMLYNRFGTRDLALLEGVGLLLPKFGFFSVYFLLANMSLPGTIGFPGELGLFIGLMSSNEIAGFITLIPLVINGLYNIKLVTYLTSGTVSERLKVEGAPDLTDDETFVLYLCAVVILIFGICPDAIMGSQRGFIMGLTELLSHVQ